MLEPDKTLSLAEQVARVAEDLGIRTALIGAAALAVHGYARGTEDLDLAVAVPVDKLRQLLAAVQAAGLRAQMRLPVDDDPLGGVLVVWASEDHDGTPTDVVEVVNFLNLLRPVANPAVGAIARAMPLEGLGLRCVGLADLVALKLYAGGRRDVADIVQVLAHNPDSDLDAIRSIAKPFDATDCLENLVAEAQSLIGQQSLEVALRRVERAGPSSQVPGDG